MGELFTKNIARVAIISLALGFHSILPTNQAIAGQLMPSVTDQVIIYGQNLSDELTYINTSDSAEELSVEIFSYDPRESEVLTDGWILMSSEVSRLTVAPGQEVVIPYQVTADVELAKGSYFNVIALIDASENGAYNGVEMGKGNVKFNLRKGEGALFAFHVTDGGEVLSAQDISVEFTGSSNWFLLPFFRVRPQITVTNNSLYPIKITGELRAFTSSGRLLNISRVEDIRLYPGENFVEEVDPDYWGFEDVKMAYSFGNNLDSDTNAGSQMYGNYTTYAVIVAFSLTILIGIWARIKTSTKK